MPEETHIPQVQLPEPPNPVDQYRMQQLFTIMGEATTLTLKIELFQRSGGVIPIEAKRFLYKEFIALALLTQPPPDKPKTEEPSETVPAS